MDLIHKIARADVPTLIGTPFAGGFYMARYRLIGGAEFALVVAGREHELVGAWGCRGIDVTGASSYIDGLANTNAMAEAGSELARAVRALRAGGCDDWCIGARDQVELQYRHGKPTTTTNFCSWRDGENMFAVPPTYAYTEESPGQTVAEAFLEGGPAAFEAAWYLTSTQFSPRYAYGQDFADGDQGNDDKGVEARVRPVRSVEIVNSPL